MSKQELEGQLVAVRNQIQSFMDEYGISREQAKDLLYDPAKHSEDELVYLINTAENQDNMDAAVAESFALQDQSVMVDQDVDAAIEQSLILSKKEIAYVPTDDELKEIGIERDFFLNASAADQQELLAQLDDNFDNDLGGFGGMGY